MREIKFRAWDKDAKKMFEAGYMYPAINFGGSVFDRQDGEEQSLDEQIVLMEYTGLKDKNGKEIYEGDVIEWSSGNGNKDRMEMKFYERHQGFMPYINYSSEIIGNIYENPELI